MKKVRDGQAVNETSSADSKQPMPQALHDSAGQVRELWYIASALYKTGPGEIDYESADQGFPLLFMAMDWCEERRDKAATVYIHEVLLNPGVTYEDGTPWIELTECDELSEWESVAPRQWACNTLLPRPEGWAPVVKGPETEASNV